MDHSRQTYHPPLPAHWRNIEGELYSPGDGAPPILYVFHIHLEDGPLETLAEMSAEIDRAYMELSSQALDDASAPLPARIRHRLHQSMQVHRSGAAVAVDPLPAVAGPAAAAVAVAAADAPIHWFPKGYWPLENGSWNAYVDQLSELFKFIHDPTGSPTGGVRHDGIAMFLFYFSCFYSITYYLICFCIFI